MSNIDIDNMPSMEELLKGDQLNKDTLSENRIADGTIVRKNENGVYVDIGLKVDERTGRVILMGVIDNMGKGSASQAVQNMNLMFGLPEETGIALPAMMP